MNIRLRCPRIFLVAMIVAIGCLVLPATRAPAQDPERQSDERAGNGEVEENPGAASEGIPYEVAFFGLDGAEAELEEAMREVSLSIQLSNQPPRTRASLRRRAEQDIDRFTRVLHSNGHYDGAVRFSIGTPKDAEGPMPLRFEIEPGPLYLIESVLIRYGEDDPREAVDLIPQALDLSIGQPAEAEPVIDAEAALKRHYQTTGYPFVSIADRTTTINRERKTLTVIFAVDRGIHARFADTIVEGATAVDPAHIRKYVIWKSGETYDIRRIEETQRALFRTGLFESVSVEAVPLAGDPATPDVGGEAQSPVDIRIEVSERDHRSIGFGVSYGTSVGPGVRASWEHRNLLSRGERLRTNIFASPIERSAEATLRKPFFLSPKQSLIAESELKDITSDAFDEVSASAFLGVERELSDTWTVTLGPTLDLIDQNANDSTQDQFMLLGFRGNLRRDSTDDLLDPTRGSRLELGLAPYQDLGESGANFLSASVTGSRYVRIDEEGDIVLAGRVRLGTIVGADRSDIPADKRFFAGGGGSVRGYDFQRIGPLDSDLDPIGGRSVMEFGLEVRLRITESIGLVPFVEAGNVYNDQTPQFDDPDLQWGGGLGLRYYTDIGPLRLDFAVPINKREGVDDDFQIYLSLGQAF